MASNYTLPPHIGTNDCVVLFDGVCKLCHGWANFVIDQDKSQRLKLCSVQSAQGQAILAYFAFPTETFDTMMLVEGPVFHTKSAAFFGVMNKLGGKWKWLTVFRFIPSGIRDWLYDRIALNRYTLFGKYQYCRVPNADHLGRYLGD